MVLNQDRRDEDTSSERGDGDTDAATRSQQGSQQESEPFDPNFDPAFQRGYTPGPGETRRTRLRNAADDSAFRRPTDTAPAAQRAYREDTWDTPPTDRSVALAAADQERDDDTVTPTSLEPNTGLDTGLDRDLSRIADRTGAAVVVTGGSILERAELSPRRNPYFLALWIMGGGFVVVGIVLYAVSVYTSYTATTDAQDVSTLVFSQVGWMLAGPLVTVGLGTIVTLVLLTALRTRARRHTSGSEPSGGEGA